MATECLQVLSPCWRTSPCYRPVCSPSWCGASGPSATQTEVQAPHLPNGRPPAAAGQCATLDTASWTLDSATLDTASGTLDSGTLGIACAAIGHPSYLSTCPMDNGPYSWRLLVLIIQNSTRQVRGPGIGWNNKMVLEFNQQACKLHKKFPYFNASILFTLVLIYYYILLFCLLLNVF